MEREVALSLYRKMVLAREFETSRTSMRTAVNMLVKEGLIVKSPRRGARVLPHMERFSQKIVGVVHSLPAKTGFSSPREPASVLAGIQSTLSRFGCRCELVSVRDSCEGSCSLVERCGALIFVETVGLEEHILELEHQETPVVVANLEVDLDVTATWMDHRKAALHAVEVLVGFGHHRIAFLGRDRGWLFYGKAREGYLAGLKRAGIVPDKKLIGVCGETNPLSAYFAAKALLEAREPPTAVVAARDILAMGACRAVTEAGLVLGRDVSVIGFDDISWPQEEPFLTTFHEPCQELGAVAAEMLVDRIVNGWRPPEKCEMEAPLVLRRSAGPLL